MKRRRLALLGFGCALGHAFSAAAGEAANTEVKKWHRRRVRVSLLLVNPTEKVLRAQKIYCYLPASISGRQILLTSSVSAPHSVIVDNFGHNVLAMEFSELPAFLRKDIAIDVILDLGPSMLESGAFSQEWLRSEPFIECDAQEIKSIAADLKRADQLSTARAAFEWIRRNIHDSGYLSEDRGALEAVVTGHGDCTEFSYLMVALCRANGIPSRMVGGHVVYNDAILAPYDYHNWAEVYISGSWIIADVQKGFWAPPGTEYLAFRFHSDAIKNAVGMGHRFRVDGEVQVALIK